MGFNSYFSNSNFIVTNLPYTWKGLKELKDGGFLFRANFMKRIKNNFRVLTGHLTKFSYTCNH